jgi:hypothetical protein
MKTKTLILCFALGIVLISSSCNNSTLSQQKKAEKEVSKMLKDFYTSYMNIILSNSFKFNPHNSDSIMNIFCTDSLIKEISNPELDQGYDPLVKAQAFDYDCLKTLTLKKDLTRDDLYYVSYIKPYSMIKETIKLLIVNENGNYKINYVYLDSPNAYTQDSTKFKDSVRY